MKNKLLLFITLTLLTMSASSQSWSNKPPKEDEPFKCKIVGNILKAHSQKADEGILYIEQLTPYPVMIHSRNFSQPDRFYEAIPINSGLSYRVLCILIRNDEVLYNEIIILEN